MDWIGLIGTVGVILIIIGFFRCLSVVAHSKGSLGIAHAILVIGVALLTICIFIDFPNFLRGLVD